MKRAYFSEATFTFLRELAANNERTWFLENKPRWERDAQGPMISFVGDLAPKLAKLSPHLVCDPKPNGGSILRIHRDTRFSKDKTPYKTWVAAHFRHDAGKDIHAPGYYVHIDPREVFFGAGIWHPDHATLGKIRDRIVEDPKSLEAVLKNKRFMAECPLGGDSLARPPRGYDKAHPMVEHLMRKDWIVSSKASEEEVVSNGFLERYVAWCKTAAPLMRWLAESLGLPF